MEEILGWDTAADIDREVLSLIKNAHDKAKSIISENMKVMHEAASFLIEKETITGKEFMDIVHCCTAKTDLNNWFGGRNVFQLFILYE